LGIKNGKRPRNIEEPGLKLPLLYITETIAQEDNPSLLQHL